jgi:hypothetical protein
LAGLKKSNKFIEFVERLSRGLARRTFILIPKVNYGTQEDNIDYRTRALIDEANAQNGKQQKEKFKLFFERFAQTQRHGQNIQLSQEAYYKFKEYEYYCKDKADSMNSVEEESVKAEIANRWSKMIRLAGILALVDLSPIVEDIHILQAVYQTEYFGKYLLEFIQTEPAIDIIKAIKKDGSIQMKDVYKIMGISKQNGSRKKTLFEEYFPELKIEAEKQGIKISKEISNGKSKYISYMGGL